MRAGGGVPLDVSMAIALLLPLRFINTREPSNTLDASPTLQPSPNVAVVGMFYGYTGAGRYPSNMCAHGAGPALECLVWLVPGKEHCALTLNTQPEANLQPRSTLHTQP